MELWYTERQTEAYGVTMRVTETLESTQTAFQRLAMVKTEQWGNMLVLDGMVMTTEQDEFVYHEMMTHPALMTHPCPKDVLVVGGGDGGVIREVLKHPSVERAVLVEIDEEVVRVSKEHLPTIAGSLSDPRVHVICGDGYMHIAQQRAAYDVILVDSTEPVGPAVELFTRGFYQGISEALRPDGLFVAQSDNPWFKADLIRNVARDVADIFEIRRVYTANIPTYPSGLWTFTMGSKQYDPLRVERSSIRDIATKYYTPDVHYGAFALPRFVAALLED